MRIAGHRQARNFLDTTIGFLAIVYTFVSFGLSGLPGVSRLSLVSAAAMAMLLFGRMQQLLIPRWILLIAALYVYLLIPGMFHPSPHWETIAGTTALLLGTVCIGLALTNGLVTSSQIVYSMFAAVVVNIIAILLGIDTTPLQYKGLTLNRFAGLLGNANTLAINFSLSALSLWLLAPRFNISIKMLSVLTALYGVYVSGSRKGVVLVATLLLIVVKRLIESSSGLKQFVILGLLLVLFFGFYLYFEEIFRILSEYVLAIDRFSRIFYGEDSSYSERIWLIEKGYQIWKESPLFGAGFGQFALISGFDAYSHNNYIELLVSGGIVAMFLYYILYLLIIYYAFKYKRNELFYAALMVITLLFIDIAAVSFLGRSTMLFIVFTLSHFSRKNDAYVANRSRSFRWNNPK